MKINLQHIFLIIYLCCFSTISSYGQSEKWRLLSENENNFAKKEVKFRKHIPIKSKVYLLNYAGFEKNLKSNFSKGKKTVELPTAKGLEKFSIHESSSLSPKLSQKFPMIKSFVGQGIDDPSKTARFSLGTDGLHVVVFSVGKKTFYVDPYTNDNNRYLAYSRKDLNRMQTDFVCMVDDKITPVQNENQYSYRNANDGLLRTYRLALVCSAEYAEFHLTRQNVAASATDAVKKAAVLSAMNTTMTRVNGVFEKDLSVKMEIVADNDKIIFLDAATDNITDGNAALMINQVQTICDTKIGDANYDIGHIFSIDGSGLAALGKVCVSGEKAKGVTGISSPVNDSFDIDYVSHEIGHQFGANHTFNNSCNDYRDNVAAVEPGSGSTIMSYAGICSPNVQNKSDDYFHAVSITNMWNIIQSSATCATTTSNGNNAPTSNAGSDYTIPKSTPFVLRGVGTDPDIGNVLSYNWEQTDIEIATMPPLSTNTGGPLFRSLPSKATPNRYMPDLATVLAGNISSEWEVVPSVAREMNFSLVVRDNNAGGGNSIKDNMKVTVDAASGPFVVTVPNTAVTWNTGSTQTITWDVANTTNVSGPNVQNVTILLSIDGGVTFPITVLSNTPNDGTQTITIPNNATNQARLMVEAVGNIFYSLNSTNFTINQATASVKDFVFSGFNLYPNPSNGTFNLTFEVIQTDKVSIQLFDIRGKLINEKDFFNTNANFSEQIDFNKTASGLYLIKITNGNKQTTRKLIIKSNN